ncbi:MAG: hypothetical protein AAF362_10040 [Pseudomonadota bacterium]
MKILVFPVIARLIPAAERLYTVRPTIGAVTPMPTTSFVVELQIVDCAGVGVSNAEMVSGIAVID